MPLPDDTKYKVANALVQLSTEHMVDVLQAVGVPLQRMDITRTDKLNFAIRLRPADEGAPRYITVKISEPW
jgi:hypothetical protein